ncbi:hypothetical protein [Shewanella sp. GutDb-MelDb]|jgi:hypothetical protein|uniref:hypothetical protein n=1 Tax=Shewanella sp. GutDb-MelDb TaxID=2058316 RepID=UPI000C79C952|nr:hypothetical protein [Shewanella sp. GutDb-MelDb]PKG59117.1 hypothetical protein CXF82_00935 [Shewanella sp. GutDb-MelDb]
MNTGKSLNKGMMSLIATLDNLSRGLRKELLHTHTIVYKDEVELYFLLHAMKASINNEACSQTESELAITFIDDFLSMHISHKEVTTDNANLVQP